MRKPYSGVGDNLAEGGLLILYGPYKYGGDFTTQSNADFDAWLKERNPLYGIRDFEWAGDLADQHGLVTSGPVHARQ